MLSDHAPRRTPWSYVPSLYFQQGLPVIFVQQFSVLLFKRMGVDNGRIVLWTSLLAWPWIIKMLWAPLVDLRGTKRGWTLATQTAIAALLTATSVALGTASFFPLSLLLLFLLAFASATHDIASDGFYLVALDPSEQAFFMGISGACFRVAMVFCTGGLVILGGLLERRGFGTARSWQGATLAAAACYGALALYARSALPRPATDRPASRAASHGAEPAFLEAFTSFFRRPRAATIIAFILIYRFSESMLTKTTGLFLLDSRQVGGLGFDAVQTGAILGTAGMLALVAGGILGGAAIARFGLRACLWPMAILMHVPHLLYVWASIRLPGPSVMSAVVALDQFAYGFGMASYMVYTMRICQGSRFRASHYAVATGLMALGAMLAGITSGALVSSLGYYRFFACACVLTVPGLFLLTRLPFDFESAEATPAGAEARA
jgi:PAT family beta-lactamase induction signal transducer AmpG